MTHFYVLQQVIFFSTFHLSIEFPFILLLTVPTVLTFLSRYIGASTATSREAQIIYTIWTESLHDYDLLRYKPSVIASSVIWLARYSQIIKEQKEKIVRDVDNIEKNSGVKRIGMVGKNGMKIEKALKNDTVVNIVEDIVCQKDLLLEQLSVRTNGYPWTSTLTHITGIFMSIFEEILSSDSIVSVNFRHFLCSLYYP
jgi:hypothetical protein